MMTAIEQQPAAVPTRAAALRVLAYVHLRNIHDSTGAGRVARQMTEHLAQRGDIDLRVLGDAGDKARVLPLVQSPWTEYRYHTFADDTSRQQARWFWLRSPRAETYWPEAQVVFCTGESFVPVQTARLAVTIHDAAYFDVGAHRRNKTYWMQRAKWMLLFRELARKADMIHTVSHFSADRLAHFFPGMRSRLRVVHNAVSPHFFAAVKPAGQTFLAQHGLVERPFVLIPGGLHFRKNADLILEALPLVRRRFPETTFAVVNHSDLEYIERARALGVKVLGFVSDDALRALHGAASVVWFPSRYEGFGMPVLEAMACGTPVVASNASSLPEIAGSAALLVDPEDASAHVDALGALLTDAAARTEFASLGRRRAAQFTWHRAADEMTRHFNRLI